MKPITRAEAAKAAGISAAIMAFLAGGMAPALQDGPANLNGLHVDGYAGYRVYDVHGAPVGEVIMIEADAEGRTRNVRIALDGAGELSVPAFRARLNVPSQEVSMTLPADMPY
jgi:hypothetical protein